MCKSVMKASACWHCAELPVTCCETDTNIRTLFQGFRCVSTGQLHCFSKSSALHFVSFSWHVLRWTESKFEMSDQAYLAKECTSIRLAETDVPPFVEQ